ncbi:unnamed protein product [Closterium sp. NIES-64]|nr:unnamed protein product [Closterium sp. NIES-64]
MPFCAVPAPPMWPAFAQVPPNAARAAAPPGVGASLGLPPATCRSEGGQSCPTFIFQPAPFLPAPFPPHIPSRNPRQQWRHFSYLTCSTRHLVAPSSTPHPRFTLPSQPLPTPPNPSQLVPSPPLHSFPPTISFSSYLLIVTGVECVDVDTVWRDTQTDIDSEVYAGHYQANPEQATNAYTAAFDFQDTGPTRYNPVIQYNSSYNNASIGGTPATLLRFARLLNLASNAFIKSFHSGDELNTASAPATAPTPAVAPAEIPLLFVKDFPKVETTLGVDFVSLLGPLFYMWVLQLLLPVMTVALVYEKEQQLRIMMRMHGLKDGPYWLVSYLYFLLLSLAYIFFLVAFGSLIQLKCFTLNPYGLQLLLYIVSANTQIALAMLLSTAFAHTRPATATTYLYVFTSALLGQFLYRNLLESGSYSSEFRGFPSFSLAPCHTHPPTAATYLYVFTSALLGQFLYRNLLESGSYSCEYRHPMARDEVSTGPFSGATFMTALQLFPAFALYHGVYELTQSSLIGSYQASQGTLTWATAATNGYLTGVVILAVEWLVFLLLAIYLDQVVSAGSGVRKHPLFFLRGCKSGCRKLLGSLKKVLQSCRIGGDARVHAAFQEGSWRNEEGKEWKAGAAGSGKAEWGEGEVGGGVVGAGHGTDVGEEKEKAKGCLDRFDVDLEKRKVQHLLHTGTTPDPSAHHSILCAGLSKVYPSRDGGAPKEAVAGMWLGVARGECLGVLGPNGAGKTTALRMMMGFLQPSGGTAIIEGMGIAEEMDSIYSIMGVACLGTLGANGAGKTTALRMMMGFLQPSGDTAVIKGMGIAEEMDGIYSIMVVQSHLLSSLHCPIGSSLFSPFLPPHPSLVPILSPLFQPPMGAADQSRPPSLLRAAQEFASLSEAVEASLSGGHLLREADKPVQQYSGCMKQQRLLWEQLTGREHLMFYGRLKNLRGSALTSAVEASLSGVHLLKEADKPVQQYSGGMKRRLSVAISLIGDPLVVYMDEPSTGLDPSSRMHLWNVVKRAKKHCAIVLTTHSMEEADALCDRMGIFVRGKFVCIGSAQELTARYGGRFIFTLTTPVDYEAAAAQLALSLSVNARRIYNLSGTQKFELPVEDVRISDVFAAVQAAKGTMPIQAWGLTNSTLEDVFIKVARQAHANVV